MPDQPQDVTHTKIVAVGQYGEALAGGRPAAKLGSWRLEVKNELEFTLTAKVAERVNNFYLQQPTFDLKLKLGKGYWRWNDVTGGAGDDDVFVAYFTGRPEGI